MLTTAKTTINDLEKKEKRAIPEDLPQEIQAPLGDNAINKEA
jgi:hypothetical protein